MLLAKETSCFGPVVGEISGLGSRRVEQELRAGRRHEIKGGCHFETVWSQLREAKLGSNSRSCKVISLSGQTASQPNSPHRMQANASAVQIVPAGAPVDCFPLLPLVDRIAA
jgi:hypothetical protein